MIGARAVDHAELIPALVCLVVGVHFFPLARLFDVPRYRLTGSALVIVAAATLITMLPLDLSAATGRAAASFGAALVLWATSSSWVGPFARA